MNALTTIVDDPYNIDKLVFSHSSSTTLGRCPRLFEFGQMYGKPPFRESSFPADVGSALHHGFETWMMTHDEDKAILAYGTTYPLEQEYADRNHANRSLEAGFVSLQALMKSEFLEEYDIAKIRLPSGEIKHAIEVPFAIEITNSPFPHPVYYVGFIDAILRHRFTGQYLVSDLKSTRSWAKDLRPKYEFDEQTVPYGIILSHILGEEIIELETSYLSVYVDILEPQVQLHKIKKTQDMMYDWHRGLCDDIARITNYYNRRWFKRATNGETCFSFQRPCSFLEYCSYRDPHVLRRMISGERRKGLFSKDENLIPWFQASLPYISMED